MPVAGARRTRQALDRSARRVLLFEKLLCVGDDGRFKDTQGIVFDMEIHNMRRLDYLLSLFFFFRGGGDYLGREKQEQR